MDYNESYKFQATKNAAKFMNASVLTYHILCALLFLLLGEYLMTAIGIAYIFVYLGMFFLIKKDHYFFTIIFLTIDMSVFNTFCCLLLGWNFGFELYVFIGIISAFYVKYLTLRKTFLFSYSLSIICLLEFVFLKIFSSIYPKEPTQLSNIAFLVNTLFTFFTIIFLMIDFSRNISFYERQLLRLSQKDALTGLNNRYNMNVILKTLHDDAILHNHNFCLGMIDIDDFKKINDSYGHECGDYVLQTLGCMLIHLESSKTKTARWGGEEFIVTHIYNDSFDNCYDMADSFRNEVATYDFVFFGKPIHVTVTIGIADYTKGMTLHELIKEADDKLYEGKRAGKNIVVR